jgi:hypothetical protein
MSVKDKYDITEKLFEKLPAKKEEENKDYEVVVKLPSDKKKKGKSKNAILKMMGEEE